MTNLKSFSLTKKPAIMLLMAVLLACSCWVGLCLSSTPAWAVGESLTMDCISNTAPSSGKNYSTTGRYLLLNDDYTGMVTHRNAAHTITSWSLDGNAFKATDHQGKTMTGTLNNGVLTVKYDDYEIQYKAGDPAPIMALSPTTWFNGLPNVVDQAGILTAEQVTTLQTRAKEISDKYQCGVYLVVLSDMKQFCEWDTIEVCAEEVRTGYQLGYGSDKDCIMLVMSMADRDYDLISYGPKATKIFDAHTREWVADRFLGAFKKNKWDAGFTDYLNAVDTVLEKNAAGIPLGRPSAPIHIIVSLFFCLLVAGPVSFVIARTFRNKMKDVSAGSEAAQYKDPEGAEITFRNDEFSHTTTSRTYSPPPKASGGGGGSRSFTSSSGSGHTSGKF